MRDTDDRLGVSVYTVSVVEGMGKSSSDPTCSSFWKTQDLFYALRQREDSHVKMEVELGVTLPPARECLGPSEPGRGKEITSLRGFGGSMALPIS